MRNLIELVVALSLAAMGGLSVAGSDQVQPTKAVGQGAAYPDLVAGLKATQGCLGVETAKTSSGKSVIFAWFEDKKAVLRWYNSDTHKEVMKRFPPDFNLGRKPLTDVPGNSGPIMAIASITPNDKPTNDNPFPFKQIAIELYQPLGGGIAIGGRFAPEKMLVPQRKGEPKK